MCASGVNATIMRVIGKLEQKKMCANCAYMCSAYYGVLLYVYFYVSNLAPSILIIGVNRSRISSSNSLEELTMHIQKYNHDCNHGNLF